MPSLQEQIELHLDRARENLESADLSLEAKLPNAAASRYYYSMYHAAIAFILKRYSGGKIRSDWSHRFVSQQLAQATRRWSSEFTTALALRHDADYIVHGGVECGEPR